VMDGLPGQGPLRHHPSGLAGLGQTPWEPSLPGNEIRRNGNGHHDAAARTGTSFHEVMDWCRSLADVEDRSLLAERVVDAPETVAPCDAVAVVWFSGETGRVHRSRGWTQELRTVCVRAGRGFAGSCAKTRKAMLLPDTNGRRVVVFAEDESPARFGSLLAAPILVQDELKGVIVCASRQPRGLTPRDQDTWTLIAAFMANALKCAEIQSQWEYDKNLCQVTGVPNHRFLSTYLRSVEAEVFRENRQVFVLTTQLRELHAIYRDYGVEAGDALLRQAISLLSQSVTTPKYIFKYSESAIVLVLMDITADQARGLSTRVRQIFRQGLAAIENQPLDPDARLGLAIHPADGRDLGALIGVSLARAADDREADVS
ncbi:MAG: diguanylate cyclase domain-containing protein, partial [Nitrospinaceae bacterium]